MRALVARRGPEACAVEVLFSDEAGLRYVVHAVGPSPESAVAAAEEEARRLLGCESTTDRRATLGVEYGPDLYFRRGRCSTL